MKNRLAKITNFWNQDRSLTVMMLLLLLFIFVFVPVLNKGRAGEIFLKAVYTFILLTGILSVTRQQNKRTILAFFAVGSIIINWVTEIDRSIGVLVADDLLTIIYNLFFAWAILFKTFKEGEITFHRIVGSIVVYLMIGLIFAYVFHSIYLIAGAGSFNNISGNKMKEFLYFSFTSLTTMGYGDITPVHPIARSLANFEALIGQLYPAILIARLVSMEFENSSNKRKSN